jgi:TonB-linked SusC/RagA family outer membrane protein
MRYIKSLVIFLAFVQLGFAQNNQISGVVMEGNSGMPLNGATIVQKGTSNGVTTDFDGNFVILNIELGDVLVVSYLGFVTQEFTVSNFSPLNVRLAEDASTLDEIIVVGYGTQRKKEITGAVSVISAETIEALNPVRIEEALQGQVAGVNITSGSGAPGAALNINIRGISTNGDNRPLILLDGNVIEDLSVVNPSTIESINVLKDATAGIYGVRAANGVILITTKNGSFNSDIKFDFRTSFGLQETTREIPVLNATQYALLVNEARTNGGQTPLFTDIAGLGQGTNWQDEVFQTAPRYNMDLAITGGTENSRTSFTVGYASQDGIVGGGDKSTFNRFNTTLAYDLNFLENFKFKSSVIYSGTESRDILQNTIGSVLYNALNNSPTFDVRDENGDFTLAEGLGNEVINPVAQIENTFNSRRVRRLSGSFALNYSFLENFEIESRMQANYSEDIGFNFAPVAFYGSGKVFNIDRNSVTEATTIFRDYTFDTFAKYANTFAEDHNVNLTIGTSIFQTTGRFNSDTGFDVPGNNGGAASIGNASNVQDNFINGGDQFDARLLSYWSRLQYDYKGKYLFSGVIRRDGSTKFGPENKFGVFPTASAGWILSEESFLNESSTFNFLKIRGSYGIIGNDRIPDFRFESLLNGEGEYVIDDELIFGTAIGALSNPEIKWEEQKTLDIGIDAKFLNNKLDITIDYFNRRTEDLLITAPVSGILGSLAPGSAPPVVNAGTVENKGFEFSVSYRDKLSDNFKFNANFNITALQNEVLFVNSENAFIPGGSFGIGQDFPSRMEAGFPIGYFYGLQTDGIFQNSDEVADHALQDGAQPGDIRFVDTNGDGLINPDDRTDIGNPIPDYTMGLNIGFSYKEWDFSAYAFSSIGNDIVRNYERFQQLTNRSVNFLDRWTGEGSNNSDPRVTTSATSNTQFSEYFVEDGSFVRLQNVQFGYTFSDDLFGKNSINGLRLYASVSNLVTLTKYRGYDPTATSNAPIGAGIDQGFYPTPKTYLLGLNFKF